MKPPQYNLNVEFQIAKLWQQKGKTERAIAGFQKILEVEPTHWPSLHALEDLLLTKGDQKTIITLYRQACSLYYQALQNYALEDGMVRALDYKQSGKIEKAIKEYQQVLAIQPAHLGALQALEALVTQQGDLTSAITAYRQAIEYSPNNAELHKRHINLIVAEQGIEAAFNYYELSRTDPKIIDIGPSDLLCCVVVRNELPRLPYFLNYYRQKGVNRFLFVDNQSTDETQNYLLAQQDVYVWSSVKSFNQVNFGSVWFELLLRRYGINHWCLTVDADELLYYPDCEQKTIPQLCQELEKRDYRAYTAILLDMYGDKPIQETHYTPGEDFLAVCPYFDRQYYHRKYRQAGCYANQTIYFGGLRERVFGATGDYILSKVPLLKYGPDRVMIGGQHLTNLPESKIAKGSGCLLHFKYFSLFTDYVAQEVQRKEHYGNSYQYSEYFRVLSTNCALKLYDETHSVALQNSQQLVELGILTVEPDSSPDSLPKYPKILSLPQKTHRPFWSVMITAYKRVDYLEQALKSVLEQAPPPEEMQIEVINDGAPESIGSEIEAIIYRVGQGRVHFYRHPENLGQPHIFNLCLERSQGQWVHLLHDDDWVEPGFYAALQAGIERNPSVGFAFCRYSIVDEKGQALWLSNLERGTPGIIPHWLERIAIHCCLQFPAVVVKREVYETLGGFSGEVGSAFDWEMWQRLALFYPVWYEPQALAYFRTHEGAESHNLILSGQQVKDAKAVIEMAQTYLPKTIPMSLSHQAMDSCALLALQLAKRQLERKDHEGAIAAIKEAMGYSQSPGVQQAIAGLFLH